jgi:patatin-like phospholipase/acyl hydrolase
MNILSIDGGGVRGLIPGMVIVEIERRLGKPVSEVFDLIAGTSAGGHIALALTVPDQDGKPQWSAQDLAAFYREAYARIFPTSTNRLMGALRGITDERYSAEGIERVLEEIFGESLLSQALTEVLVTAFEVESGQPHFFLRSEAKSDPRKDHHMKFVARATSAAPTYFEPAAKIGSEEKLAFIDGGVFANNPTMCGFAHAQKLGFDEDEMTIVSIGTGAVSRELAYEEVRDWGLAHWARPILDITAQAGNHAIDWQLNQMLRKGHYFRIQPLMSGMRSSLDDARPETVTALEETAREVIERSTADIDRICALISN